MNEDHLTLFVLVLLIPLIISPYTIENLEIFSSMQFIQYAEAVELRHFIEKELTCATTGSTATALTVQNGTDFNMTENTQYLLIAEGKFGGLVVSKSISIEVQHNGTQFEGSFLEIEPKSASSGCGGAEMYNYLWLTVYNATDNEALTIEVEAVGGGNTITFDDFKLAIIELSVEFLEDLHWFFDINTIDSPLGSNFNTTNSANVTITPQLNSTWLVMGTAELDTGTATANFESRGFFDNISQGFNFTGSGLSQEGEDPTEENFVQTFGRLIELNGTETVNISVQSQIDDPLASGTNQRLSNSIFAMNVDLLKTQNFTFTLDDFELNVDAPFAQEVATIDVTPEVEGDFFIFGGSIKEADLSFHMRLQTDDIDTPSDQTTDEYQMNDGWDLDDQLQTSIFDIVNLNITTHKIDIDASALVSNSTLDARSLFAFSFELETFDEERNQTDTMIINDINPVHFFDTTHNQTETMIINDTSSFFFDIFLNQTDSMSFVDTSILLFDIFLTQIDSFRFADANVFQVIEPPPEPTGGAGGAGTAGSPSPTLPDSDFDGIPDIDDQCPFLKEDFDGFEDQDGCPEGEDITAPPLQLQVTDFVNLIPFDFNELDVIDDFIVLETDSPQPQVENLGIRWLGAEPITITSINIGQSPFEIQIQDIPIQFGNSQFGYTAIELLYTVQEPDTKCGDVFTFNCLDTVTYDIPVVVSGEINGKTVIAEGSIVIDNSGRTNPFLFMLWTLLIIPLIGLLLWKRRKGVQSTKTILNITHSKAGNVISIKSEKPLKAGTTRSKLDDKSTFKITRSKESLKSEPQKFKSIKDKGKRRNILGR